ncbi:hypothetical protein [Phenylobacterium sp.]|uniref:hypothetical protein n=1 Tax=Phenylobacterium sp. TaxID=1871053 RepID=UPI00301BCF42
MLPLLRSPDTRRLLTGVALAAAAGLALGATLKPNLDEEPLEGPQQLISGGGPRTYVQAPDAGMAAYRGRVPDYVVGTDSLKPPPDTFLALDDQADAPEAGGEAAASAQDHGGDVMAYEAPVVARARWADEPRPVPHHPSQQGGAWNESDLPAPPSPPEEDLSPL